MSPLRVLIIDGNPRYIREAIVTAGAHATGEEYARIVKLIVPEAECTIVRPADDGPDLPEGMALTDFDGFFITGSGLNAYDEIPEVMAQKTLCARAFESGVPGFGSCWGLQIMCAALGGTVRENPKGREMPYGRAITINDVGREHPLLAGKPDVFDAFAIHMDEVSALPEGSTLLASNAMSHIQAVEIRRGESLFWGVQYHPEFTPREMAGYLHLRAADAVKAGLYETLDAVETDVRGLTALEDDPEGPARQALHLDAWTLDFDKRTREIRNFLEMLVEPPFRE